LEKVQTLAAAHLRNINKFGNIMSTRFDTLAAAAAAGGKVRPKPRPSAQKRKREDVSGTPYQEEDHSTKTVPTLSFPLLTDEEPDFRSIHVESDSGSSSGEARHFVCLSDSVLSLTDESRDRGSAKLCLIGVTLRHPSLEAMNTMSDEDDDSTGVSSRSSSARMDGEVGVRFFTSAAKIDGRKSFSNAPFKKYYTRAIHVAWFADSSDSARPSLPSSSSSLSSGRVLCLLSQVDGRGDGKGFTGLKRETSSLSAKHPLLCLASNTVQYRLRVFLDTTVGPLHDGDEDEFMATVRDWSGATVEVRAKFDAGEVSLVPNLSAAAAAGAVTNNRRVYVPRSPKMIRVTTPAEETDMDTSSPSSEPSMPAASSRASSCTCAAASSASSSSSSSTTYASASAYSVAPSSTASTPISPDSSCTTPSSTCSTATPVTTRMTPTPPPIVVHGSEYGAESCLPFVPAPFDALLSTPIAPQEYDSEQQDSDQEQQQQQAVQMRAEAVEVEVGEHEHVAQWPVVLSSFASPPSQCQQEYRRDLAFSCASPMSPLCLMPAIPSRGVSGNGSEFDAPASKRPRLTIQQPSTSNHDHLQPPPHMRAWSGASPLFNVALTSMSQFTPISAQHTAVLTSP